MTAREKFRLRSLILAATFIMGLGVVAIGVTVWKLRADAIEDAYRSTGNLATVLSEQTALTVRAIEHQLIILNERLNSLGIPETHDLGIMATAFGQFILKTQLERFPQADVISLIGSDGHVLVSSRGWPTEPTNVSDRDYFKHFVENNGSDTYISLPVVNRTSGVPTIFFARPITRADGALLGVAIIGVPIASFRHVYETIGLLSNLSLAFFRNDGTVLVRYPDTQARAGQKLPAGSPWYDIVARGQSGQFRSPGVFDTEARLISVRAIPGFPLVVNVGTSEATALAVWRQLAGVILVGTVLGVISSAVLLFLLVNQFGQLRESRAQLAKKSRELKIAHDQINAAISNMAQGITMFDADQRLVLFNTKYLDIYGLSPEKVRPGCTLQDILAQRKLAGMPHDETQVLSEFSTRLREQKDFSQLTMNTGDRVVAITTHPMPEGGWVSVHEDITERHRAEEQTAFLARHDALTGLPNRMEFENQFAAALKRMQRHGERFAVMIIDLDKFKEINDTFGHPTGDALLKEAAARLRSCLRETDTVARLGGDEFGILLTHLEDIAAGARATVHRLLDIFATPFQFGEHWIRAGLSIGIALAPRDGESMEDLVRNADLALYRAKTEGRNRFRFFEASKDTPVVVAEGGLRIA